MGELQVGAINRLDLVLGVGHGRAAGGYKTLYLDYCSSRCCMHAGV
jgi:hypothetical protein